MKTMVNSMNAHDLALLLTAYERIGSVDRDDLVECIADELTIDISIISEYNEWCYNNAYYEDAIRPIGEIEDELDNMTPHEAFRLAYSSKFSWADDYYKWDGNGNVKSMTESAALDMICDNDTFIKWYVENYILDDLDVDGIIAECNELIRRGF